MDRVNLVATTADEKLNILWESAMRAGQPVSVRIDPDTHMALRANGDLHDGGTHWRGLPIMIEIDLRYRGEAILTIMATDMHTKRIRYFNWPENPEGYR